MNQKIKFIIRSDLPDLNKYIKAERSHKMAGASLKKKATQNVTWEIQKRGLPRYQEVFIEIIYFCKNKRIDKDNIAFKKKFLFDGLEKAKIIPRDGWNNIKGWKEDFKIDKENPRIEMLIFGLS